MSCSYIKDKIKGWFRSKGWKVKEAKGTILNSPVDITTNINSYYDDIAKAVYIKESKISIENNNKTGYNQIAINMYIRKRYFEKSVKVSLNENGSKTTTFEYILTNKRSTWENIGTCHIQAATILKLAELIKENQKQYKNLNLDNYKKRFPPEFLKVDNPKIQILGINVPYNKYDKNIK